MRFTNKAIALTLGLFIILNIFSGCTFSKKMRADMGFVINKEDYYYVTNSETPNSFLYVNNATDESQEYTWGYPNFSPDCIDVEDVDFYVNGLNSNFAIVTYKNDSLQGMQSNKLYKHVADEFVYLNPESKIVECLFRSNAYEIVIYGTLEHVIVYNAEYNVYRYVSLVDDSIIHEVESNIDPFKGDYGFDVHEKKQICEVYQYNTILGKTTLIDSVSLNHNQYLQ